jgi:hypothetical protein
MPTQDTPQEPFANAVQIAPSAARHASGAADLARIHNAVVVMAQPVPCSFSREDLYVRLRDRAAYDTHFSFEGGAHHCRSCGLAVEHHCVLGTAVVHRTPAFRIDHVAAPSLTVAQNNNTVVGSAHDDGTRITPYPQHWRHSAWYTPFLAFAATCGWRRRSSPNRDRKTQSSCCISWRTGAARRRWRMGRNAAPRSRPRAAIQRTQSSICVPPWVHWISSSSTSSRAMGCALRWPEVFAKGFTMYALTPTRLRHAACATGCRYLASQGSGWLRAWLRAFLRARRTRPRRPSRVHTFRPSHPTARSAARRCSLRRCACCAICPWRCPAASASASAVCSRCAASLAATMPCPRCFASRVTVGAAPWWKPSAPPSPTPPRAKVVFCCPCSELQLWREVRASGVWPGLPCCRASQADLAYMTPNAVRQRYEVDGHYGVKATTAEGQGLLTMLRQRPVADVPLCFDMR